MKKVLISEEQLKRIIQEEFNATQQNDNPQAINTPEEASPITQAQPSDANTSFELSPAAEEAVNNFLNNQNPKYVLKYLLTLLTTFKISLAEVSPILFSSLGRGQESMGILGILRNLFGLDQDDTEYEIDGNWLNAVKNMGEWYERNVHTYQGMRSGRASGRRMTYRCPLVGGGVEDDCSSFVKACLKLYGVNGIDNIHVATATMQPGSQFDRILLNNGFKRFPYSTRILRPGDIICGGPRTHTEVYAGNGRSYSWGNIHDGIGRRQGMPCRMATKTNYRWIWRAVDDDDNDSSEA